MPPLKTLGSLALAGVALSALVAVPLPSDACSYADPCTLESATQTLSSPTVTLQSGEGTTPPAWLEQDASLIFDGNGRPIQLEVDGRIFDLRGA